MPILTRHAVFGFIAGIIFVAALEGAGLYLFMNSFGPDDSLEEVNLSAPPVPSGVSLQDLTFTFSDMQGHQHNSAELQGRVAIVNLWATWCPPCRAEMPSLDALWQKYQDKVGVYCISEEAMEDVRVHPVLKALEMPVYVFSSDAPRQLDTKGLPTTYIFGKDGHLIFSHTGMAQWDSPEVFRFLDSLQ